MMLDLDTIEVRELERSLSQQRATYRWWLAAAHSTDIERSLAHDRIAVIDQIMRKVGDAR